MLQDNQWESEPNKESGGPQRFMKGEQMNSMDFHYCYNLVYDPNLSYQEKIQEILQNKKYASALQLFLTGNYVLLGEINISSIKRENSRFPECYSGHPNSWLICLEPERTIQFPGECDFQ